MGGEGGMLRSKENSYLKWSSPELASCSLGGKCVKPSLPVVGTFIGFLEIPISGDLLPAAPLTHNDGFPVSKSFCSPQEYTVHFQFHVTKVPSMPFGGLIGQDPG